MSAIEALPRLLAGSAAVLCIALAGAEGVPQAADAVAARFPEPATVYDTPGLQPGRDRFTGYENHAGGTTLGAGVAPLGRVLAGVGIGDGTEGAVQGHIIGTYLHGPCLVRNPDIADQLLSWATGAELGPLVDDEVAELRAERLRTVLGG